ncbi:hypothetical protein GCM10010249_29950 [Streptomyces roseolilacinus]|uniref:Uncharacterized protein n=1 Tax=Streptomyces roseolilacinus TaxID=66904 RepID=A0A918EKZ6_9ACTN|nr:hypothetical protein GCM10010249_29950 [Streptomyces roseolilacinus]
MPVQARSCAPTTIRAVWAWAVVAGPSTACDGEPMRSADAVAAAAPPIHVLCVRRWDAKISRFSRTCRSARRAFDADRGPRFSRRTGTAAQDEAEAEAAYGEEDEVPAPRRNASAGRPHTRGRPGPIGRTLPGSGPAPAVRRIFPPVMNMIMLPAGSAAGKSRAGGRRRGAAARRERPRGTRRAIPEQADGGRADTRTAGAGEGRRPSARRPADGVTAGGHGSGRAARVFAGERRYGVTAVRGLSSGD